MDPWQNHSAVAAQGTPSSGDVSLVPPLSLPSHSPPGVSLRRVESFSLDFKSSSMHVPRDAGAGKGTTRWFKMMVFFGPFVLVPVWALAASMDSVATSVEQQKIESNFRALFANMFGALCFGNLCRGGVRLACVDRLPSRNRDFVVQLDTSASHVFGGRLSRRRPCSSHGVRTRRTFS